MSNPKELVKSGKVATGRVLRLESIPIPFLRDVPLFECQWLDRGLVELTEWGAMLKAYGFQGQEDDGSNLLATLQSTQDGDQKVTTWHYDQIGILSHVLHLRVTSCGTKRYALSDFP